jgi:hypothetical protein
VRVLRAGSPAALSLLLSGLAGFNCGNAGNAETARWSTLGIHREAEEIYYLVEGSGDMELDGDRRHVGVGDAVLIPPSAWHEITAGAERAAASSAAAPPPTATRTRSSHEFRSQPGDRLMRRLYSAS